jgi:hypothetical protein
MHWLCFHLEYEHCGYDPDEPCDDTGGCPIAALRKLSKLLDEEEKK